MLDAGAKARLAGTRFGPPQRVATAASTNDLVAEMARAGAPEGVVVVADHQSTGRGRRRRTWEAPPGSSLLVSVLLRPPAPHPVAMAAGLAARDACRVAAGVTPGLKWPNDLLAGGDGTAGKLAGVLAELWGGGVVVGLGLNVDWGDRPLPPGAVALADVAARPVDRDDLLVEYLVALDRRCRQHLDELTEDYRQACVTVGRAVTVELPGGERRCGLATDVDENGRLVLDGHPIAAGDVVHVR